MGTRESGLKTFKKLGRKHYSRIGKIGGSRKVVKGFAKDRDFAKKMSLKAVEARKDKLTQLLDKEKMDYEK